MYDTRTHEYTISWKSIDRYDAIIKIEHFLQGKIPNPKIQKILKLCEYIGNFLLIATQVLLAPQIHSMGVKLTPENLAIFRFCVIIREL